MLNDLSSAVIDCTVCATLCRFSSTALEKGRKQEPIREEKEILASISPLTARDLKRFPEGQLAEGTILIITTEELHTVSSSKCQIADEVIYKDTCYQISTVNDWYDLGGFYEAIGTRLKR